MSEKRPFDIEWIEAIASVACLHLEQEETVRLAADVGEELRILSEEMSKICSETPIEHWQDGAVELCALSEDNRGECLGVEELLNGAAHRRENCFLVPRVLGNGGEGA